MKAPVRSAAAFLLAALVLTVSRATAAAVMAAGTTWAPYGSRPVVHCRPLYLTDIELGAGEHITTLAAGDSARWRFARGRAGDRAAVEHVFVKPTTFATATNLEILTNRRLYDVELRNDGRAYTARLAFYAPRAARRQSAIAQHRVRPSASHARHVRFVRDYLVSGPMNVSHTTTRTYVSLRGAPRDRRVAFTTDVFGRRFLPVVHRQGSTYELRGIASRLYAWVGPYRIGYALRWTA